MTAEGKGPVERRWLPAAGFTLCLILLVAFAASETVSLFIISIVGVIAAAVGTFAALFPRSRFFAISLANFLSLYTCIYVFFSKTNFPDVSPLAGQIGFALPVLAFLLGAWLGRNGIRALVSDADLRADRRHGHVGAALAVLFLVAAFSFWLPGSGVAPALMDWTLLASMASIAVASFVVSREICVFLLETGLLFEKLFDQLATIAAPAFVFFTFYSLVVIVFASLYRILDHYTLGPHFNFAGAAGEISFLDSLYFSIITLSTVGYGDLTPVSGVARVIVGIQIVVGVLLLLFGFAEITRYARERRSDGYDREP